jgi:uncharacterized membrane protein YfcA
VPFLYEVFRFAGVREDICMQLAVGTSLAIIIPTTFRSFRSHYMHGAVGMPVVRRIGPSVAAGVIAGVFVAGYTSAPVLKAVFAGSALLIALRMFAGGQRANIASDLPGNPADAVFGVCMGMISTLIGIAGGIYISTYMTLFGRTIHQAVATSSAFGPIIAIPAVAGYIWVGCGACTICRRAVSVT